ncbi:hypothetical protein BJ138DRAFT_1116697 [Hygrophoropsis aurantiaca]|uniref:Uncharacterized protein n=1 Tax=Hygrophoropsis aurantiaca TaxID=72124 RepID=A0ACB8A200_9AGAM|nr:hypothetical protein BJ138DRAFT_1116697 [Hygrophoropsis aurantiaca]
MSRSLSHSARNADERVLSSGDLVSQILSCLSLRDILDNAALVNTTFQIEAKYTAVARFSSILSPYVSDHVHALVDLLNGTRSIVVGSCALKMFQPPSSWQPNNLNIIVPRNSLNKFMMFFNSKRYSPVRLPVAPHLTHYLSQYFLLQHSERRPVSIAESMDDTVLTPFLAASCTAEFICMTGGGLACMYPMQTSSNLALRSPSNRGIASVWETLKDRGFCLKTTLQHRPHDVCPAKWRRINGLRDTWIKEWEELNSVLCIFIGEHHRWRLGTPCTNFRCPHKDAA